MVISPVTISGPLSRRKPHKPDLVRFCRERADKYGGRDEAPSDNQDATDSFTIPGNCKPLLKVHRSSVDSSILQLLCSPFVFKRPVLRIRVIFISSPWLSFDRFCRERVALAIHGGDGQTKWKGFGSRHSRTLDSGAAYHRWETGKISNAQIRFFI